MNAYIISDLHLCKSRPETVLLFKNFLSEKVIPSKSTLYIIGDFFEVWISDDIATEFQIDIMNALKKVTEAGCQLFFIHGNRDFLIGSQFAKETGCTLLNDPHYFKLGQKQLCLMHGDLLCTDDKAYQVFRKFVRNPFIKFLFSSFPKRLREKIARRIRSKSESKKTRHAMMVDVTEKGINQYCKNTDLLIHGHTHLLNTHQHGNLTRFVLGDWHDTGSYIHIRNESAALYYFDPAEQIGNTFNFQPQ